MMITYRCKSCGHKFDGHWKLYPNLMIIDAIKRAMECKKCGNKDYKRNIDHDEPVRPRKRHAYRESYRELYDREE